MVFHSLFVKVILQINKSLPSSLCVSVEEFEDYVNLVWLLALLLLELRIPNLDKQSFLLILT